MQALYDTLYGLNRTMRDLETGGKPVAAAINGLALGGGFELTLCCHHRVLADDPKAQVGLPEVKVGLLPGSGGTQRVARMLGAQQALMMITEGKSYRPQEALSMGLVHQVVPADQVVEAARTWVARRAIRSRPGTSRASRSRRRPLHAPGQPGVHRGQRHAAASRATATTRPS
jgi:3-hydroxyacyl-CoA dehydrogenase/enoyl-CoA hydratase/3-hydroxybutyryl-CoA epimerase